MHNLHLRSGESCPCCFWSYCSYLFSCVLDDTVAGLTHSLSQPPSYLLLSSRCRNVRCLLSCLPPDNEPEGNLMCFGEGFCLSHKRGRHCSIVFFFFLPWKWNLGAAMGILWLWVTSMVAINQHAKDIRAEIWKELRSLMVTDASNRLSLDFMSREKSLSHG